MSAIEAVEKSLAIADKRGEPYVCATVELKREDLRAVLARVAELKAELEAAESTFDDEEAAHAETLKQRDEAIAARDAARTELAEVSTQLKQAHELWLEFVTPRGLCGLCGNHGRITVHTSSPAGVAVDTVRAPCICPNGRSIKSHGGVVGVVHFIKADAPANPGLKFWHDDTEFVIAESPEDATRVLQEFNGPDWKPDCSLEEFTTGWQEWPADKEFTLDEDGKKTKGTVAAFISKFGRHYLGSTEY